MNECRFNNQFGEKEIRVKKKSLMHNLLISPFTESQGHCHLGYSIHLIGLYLGTKNEVCGSNRLWDMSKCQNKIHFDLEIWP